MATWCPRLVISSKDHKLEEVATGYQFKPVASSGVVANCNEYDVHLAERPASGGVRIFPAEARFRGHLSYNQYLKIVSSVGSMYIHSFI